MANKTSNGVENSISELKNKRLSMLWQIVVLLIFPFMIVLGLLMRMNQAELIKVHAFYSLMTMHGMGMAGILFSGAYAGLWYFLSKDFNLSRGTHNTVLYIVTVGFIGFVVATLVGHFAPGWYLLYPLPFMGKVWPNWSTCLAIISLLIMGIGWTIGLIALLVSMSKKYGLTNILGWQYIRTKDPEIKTKPIYMITAIMSIAGILGIIAGGWMLIMYLFQFFEPSLKFNALMQKNLTFFFGHTITNITLYMGVAWVYEMMPKFTGRKWGMDRAVALAWNATFFLMCFAFFHHMYMDFHEPRGLADIGQFASYFSAIPSSVVTMVGLIVNLYKSKASTKWQITPLLFFLGTAGWAVGGVAAVLDSTITLNSVFHNTLWVNAHFHTYFLMGYVPFLLGFIYYLFKNASNPKADVLAKIGVAGFVVGACGFLTMFYLGGLNSIPRRLSDYAALTFGHLHSTGELLAYIAVYFIILVLAGLTLFYISLFKSLPHSWKTKIKTDVVE